MKSYPLDCNNIKNKLKIGQGVQKYQHNNNCYEYNCNFITIIKLID